jgi:3-phenylpropionate/trans-cinnamate dioxygenase ferredoxin reductase subunit
VKTAVIVGAGVAGVSAAAALRTTGFDGRVVLVGAEPELPYRRPPLSKEVLRGENDGDGIRLKAAAWFADNDVDLLGGVEVIGVDVDGHAVTLDDGARLGYDRLLLATGGRARLLPGTRDLPGVRTLRTLADVPTLRGELAEGRSVLVIGAGLIGAEVAASARALGCSVTMLEAADLPLARLLPPSIGRVYAALHRNRGVELHTGVAVDRIESVAEGVLVTAADGRRWEAQLAVVAVGMVPNTGLAERAGLAVADGIVVDASCATSAPDVFAAGDVANAPNLVLGGRHRVEHWQHAQNQGAVAARAMLGLDVSFDEVPWCWSEQYEVNLQVTGWPTAADDVAVRGDLEALDFLAVFSRGGRLTGAVGIGRPADVRTIRRLIAEAPFSDGGTDLVLADSATPVAVSPSDALV